MQILKKGLAKVKHKHITTLAALLSCWLPLSAFAAFVDAVDFDRQGVIDKAHSLTFVFAEDPNTINCGLSIDWGDGQSQELRLGRGLDVSPPFKIEHVYRDTGTKVLSIRGVIVVRGLGTVGPCKASYKDQITVTDPAIVEKQRLKLEAEQRAIEEAKQKAIQEATQRLELDRQRVAMEAAQKTEVPVQAKQVPEVLEVTPMKISNPEMTSKIEAEVKERLWKQSPEYKKLQEEMERQKTSEDRASVERTKREQAEAVAIAKDVERKRIAEEKITQDRARKEQAEAIALAREMEKKRQIEEREQIAREKKEQAEALAFAKEFERKRVIAEREQLAREKIERQEAERRQLVEAQERLEQEKRERAEANLLRPLIDRQDPRLSCQSRWEFDSRFAALATRISLTGLTDLSFPMLSNQSMPNAKEQQAIALLADEFKKCINQSSQYRSSNYSKDVNSLLEREDAAFLEAAIDLYAKKVNFGTYNQRVQQIAKDSRSSLTSLEQQMKSQKAAQEEAARTRAATLRDAQIRQTEQRQAEQRRQDQIRQAEQARISTARSKWSARCDFERRNAYERYQKSKENDCKGGNSLGLAVLCSFSVTSSADDYGKAAYDSCMSGAP